MVNSLHLCPFSTAPRERYCANSVLASIREVQNAFAADAVQEIASPALTDPVTDPVERLLRAWSDPQATHSLRELMERCGLQHKPHFRQRFLHPALAHNWLELTQPEQPNSRQQRYRLTEAGRQQYHLLHRPRL